MKYLALFLLCCNCVAQQNPYDSTFSVTKRTVLVAGTEVVTVQHPTTSLRNAKIKSFYIYSSVATTFTLERSGTIASTTTLAIVAQNPNNPLIQTSQCQAFSSSNVGTGTVINTYDVPAGGFMAFDTSTNFQLPSGLLDNITIRSSSVSGTVVIQIVWQEL